jgi:uncharacterized membrane protein required for colicin V production
MTTLDVLILVVFIGAVAVGFYRGVIVQVGAVVALLFAVFLSRVGGDALTAYIAGAYAPTLFDTVAAKAILFIVGYVSVRLVALLFKRVTHALSLGVIDRLGGVVFSLFQWMLVFSLMLNFYLVIKPDANLAEMSTLANGHAAPTIVSFAPAVLGWVMG